MHLYSYNLYKQQENRIWCYGNLFEDLIKNEAKINQRESIALKFFHGKIKKQKKKRKEKKTKFKQTYVSNLEDI